MYNDIRRQYYCNKLLAIVLPLMALLTACSSDDEQKDDSHMVTLQGINATIEGTSDEVTRLHIGTNSQTADGEDLKTYFDTNDKIYCSVTFEHDGTQHPYNHTGGGTFASTTSPLQFDNTKNQHLIAFYRGDYESTGAHRRRLRNGYTFTVPTDQSSEQGTYTYPGFMDGEFLYAHTDITADMVGEGKYPSLTFKHKTSRLILRVHLISDTAVDDDGTVIGTKYKADNVSAAYFGCNSGNTGNGSTPTVTNSRQNVTYMDQSTSANGLIYTNSVVTLDENTASATYGNVTLNTITSGSNNYRKVLKGLRRQKGDKEVWFTVVFPPQTFSAPSYGFFNVVFKKEGGSNENYLFPLLIQRVCEEGKVYYYDVLIGSHKPNSGI